MLDRAAKVIAAHLVTAPYLEIVTYRFIIELHPAFIIIKRIGRIGSGHEHTLTVADKEYMIGIALIGSESKGNFAVGCRLGRVHVISRIVRKQSLLY